MKVSLQMASAVLVGDQKIHNYAFVSADSHLYGPA